MTEDRAVDMMSNFFLFLLTKRRLLNISPGYFLPQRSFLTKPPAYGVFFPHDKNALSAVVPGKKVCQQCWCRSEISVIVMSTFSCHCHFPTFMPLPFCHCYFTIATLLHSAILPSPLYSILPSSFFHCLSLIFILSLPIFHGLSFSHAITTRVQCKHPAVSFSDCLFFRDSSHPWISMLSHLKFHLVAFLDAFSHLYKRVCLSVGPSVRPSVRPSHTSSISEKCDF